MKILHYLFPFLFIIGHIQSVHSEKIHTDTLLTRYFEQASSLMSEGKYDSAQYFFDKAFAMPGVKSSPIYPILLNELGTLHFYRGELRQAREAKKTVLSYLDLVDNLETHISVYNDLGILFHRNNQNDSAIYCYHKALDTAEKFQDDSWSANLHMNVSVFYFNLKRYQEAEKHIDQALKYVLKTDDRTVILYTWQVRSAIKAEIGKIDESGESIQRAWNMACENGGNSEWQIRCIPSLYRYFSVLNQTDSIDYYIRKGNMLIHQLPPYSVSVTGFIQVRSEYNLQREQYQEALNDLRYLSNVNSGSNNIGLYQKIAKCYKNIGRLKEAYTYMDSARMWTDSLAKKEVTTQMADFDSKYEAQTKQLEISRLEQQLLKKESYILKGIIVLTIILAIFFFCLLRFRNKQQKAAKEVFRLKQEKELTSARSYIEGLEEECKYLAKELHDGIANDLLGLQMNLEVSSEKQSYQYLASQINQIRKNIRSISHELMPPEFEQSNLDKILTHYAETFTTNSGTETTFQFTDNERLIERIPHSIARELYRIVQEITSNIIIHSSATRIEIILALSTIDNCLLIIKDNSTDIQSLKKEKNLKGIGLRTVNDRIKALNGTLQKKTENNMHIFELEFTLPQL